jgi:hypothetical protein
MAASADEGEIGRLPMTELAVARVGCDQHRDAHRAQGRRVRHQRPQMVVLASATACKIIVMGVEPTRKAQAAVADPVPLDTPGVKIVRMLRCGFDDAPHAPRSSPTTSACLPRTCCSAKAAASRWRKAASGPGPSTPPCARRLGGSRP